MKRIKKSCLNCAFCVRDSRGTGTNYRNKNLPLFGTFMEIKKHNRKSIRLHEYDYASPGIYFITICTYNKKCLFGNGIDDKMKLNNWGDIVKQQWLSIPKRFDVVQLDEFIVMPNHIHGIIQIPVGAPLAGAHSNNVATIDRATAIDRVTAIDRATARVAPTIGAIIGAYKSLCVNHCLQYIKQNYRHLIFGKLWQRNYYEHIIRNEISLNKIREYIINNPIKWQFDRHHLTGNKK